LSSRPGETIRAVSFDLGGTLITASPSVGAIYASVCREHGLDLPVEACDRSFEAAWARRSAAVSGGRDRFSSFPGGEEAWWRGVILEVLGSCHVPAERAPAVESFRSAFASAGAWKVFEDVPATLDALRAAGYRLAILSNWDSRMPALLGRLDLLRRFDAVLCSALEGLEKPHPEFFGRIAAALGIPAAQTLHVGDLVREDYLGATRAGMKALWLDRRGNGSTPGDDVEPRHVVNSIAEVARVLADGTRAPS
jgi:putative hydrolase of the HAD superfamily